MRIKVKTLGLVGIVLAALVGLAVTVLRSDAAPSGRADNADAGDPRARLASRLRGRSLPRFNTIEQPPPPPEPLAPPALTPPPPPPPPPPPTEQGELKERASRDGFVFREAGNAAVYLVQAGTKFHIKSQEDLYALGYNWDRVEIVPPGSLTFLRDRPPEKTLLRERDQAAVFYYENGQKRWISSQETFERLGHRWADVKVVPAGSLGSEATGSPIQ